MYKKLLFGLTFLVFGLFACTANTDSNTSESPLNPSTEESTSVNRYDVKYYDREDNLVYAEYGVEEGKTVSIDFVPPPYENETNKFTFSHWEPEVGPIYEDTEYYPIYDRERIAYTINLDYDHADHDYLPSKIYSLELEKASFPLSVRKDQVNFRGWSYNDELIIDQLGNVLKHIDLVEGITFKATFSDKVKVIPIIDDEFKEFCTETLSLEEYNQFSTVRLSLELSDEVVFVGWYNEDHGLISEELEFDYNLEYKDLYLYPKIEFKSYKAYLSVSNNEHGQVDFVGATSVYYDSNKGCSYIFAKKGYEISVTVTRSNNKNISYLGWYNGETLLSKNMSYKFTMPASDYEVTAKWDSFTIEYNLDGGSITEVAQKTYKSTTSTFDLKFPYKQNQLFVGWYTDEDYTTLVKTIKKGSTTNYKLYAKWETVEELKYLNYVNDGQKIIIQSAKNLDIKEIIVPSYIQSENFRYPISSIAEGAFAYCSNLESITLPFIGQGYYSTDYTKNMHFAYIFGTKSFTNSSKITYYQSKDGTSGTTYTYYIPNNLECVTITDESHIFRSAFSGCSNLTSITLNNKVTSIDEYAFSGCTNVEYITNISYVTSFGDGAFYNCQSLKEITIGNKITSLPYNLFGNCKSLTSLVIPDTVTSIGGYLIEGCDSLESLTLPFFGDKDGQYTANISSIIGNPKSLKEITITKMTNIPSEGFKNCTSVETINLPSNISNIYYEAFMGCTSLKNVNIPSTITTLNTRLFKGCTSLEEIVLPDSITIIYNEVFSGCTNLKDVTMPANIVQYGDDVFKDCTSLEPHKYEYGIYIGSKTNPYYILVGLEDTTQTSYALNDQLVIVEKGVFKECSNVTTLELPESVRIIKPGALKGLSKLERFASPLFGNDMNGQYGGINGTFASLFGDEEFPNTYEIEYTSVYRKYYYYIPKTLKEIEQLGPKIQCNSYYKISSLETYICDDRCSFGSVSFFSGCTKLKNVTIPHGTTMLLSGVFENCTSLTEIVIPNSVTELAGCFQGCTNLKSITFEEGSKLTFFSAFGGCTNLENFDIPKTVTEIGSSAFNGCTKLTSLTLHEGITTIYQGAFRNCTNLKEIVIPSTVTQLDGLIFEGCSSLESITISTAGRISSYFSLPFGSLFATKTFDNTVSVKQRGISNGEVTENTYYIPKSLKTINITGHQDILSYAFENMSLDTVILSDNVKTVGYCAFQNTKINNLGLGSSLTKFERSSTNNSSYSKNITNVFYNGSIEDWGTNIEFSSESYQFCYYVKNLYTQESSGNTYEFNGDHYAYVQDFVISEGIKSFTRGSYVALDQFVSIHIPSSFEQYYSDVFWSCKNIEIATLDAGCSLFPFPGDSWGSYYIDDLYFNGNLSDWMNMKKDESHHGGRFKNIYFIDENGNISYQGNKYSKPTSINIDEGTKSVQSYEFRGFSGITNIYIPVSVTNLGNSWAPYNSDGINMYYAGTVSDWIKIYTSYDYNNVSMFYLKDNNGDISYEGQKFSPLIDLVIPSDVVSTYENTHYKFAGIKSIETVTLPSNITTIPYGAFAECSSLRSINIPNSTKYIYGYAFSGCASLTSITIPKNVETIGGSAFSSCTSLEEVTFESDSKLASIQDSVFSGCTSLKEVILPDSVTSVGSSLFSSCTSLETVYIPNGVKQLSNSIFYMCSSLKTIHIPFVGLAPYSGDGTGYLFGALFGANYAYKDYDWATKITQQYKSGTSIYTVTYQIPTSLTEVYVGGETIGPWAFMNCTTLKKIHLDSELSTIRYGAFTNCSNLESITIPGNVRTIEYEAFLGCSNLETVIFEGGASSLTIEYDAFKNCSNLTNLVLPANLKSVGKDTFANCDNLTNLYYDGSTYSSISFSNTNANPKNLAANFYIFDNNGTVTYNGKKYRLVA